MPTTSWNLCIKEIIQAIFAFPLISSEENIFFYFSHCNQCEILNPRTWDAESIETSYKSKYHNNIYISIVYLINVYLFGTPST